MTEEEEVDFERLRKVFTTENAFNKFIGKLQIGETGKAFFTPKTNNEEITVYYKQKQREGDILITIRRINQDALLPSYNWDMLDFEFVEEFLFSPDELNDACDFF